MSLPGRGSAALALTASVILLAGCGAADVAQPEVSPGTTSSTAPRDQAPSAGRKPRETGPRPIPKRTARVVGLELPSIGLSEDRLEQLRLLPDGSLAAPKNPALAGWYGDGPVPGELGPAIIAGHVDSKTGPAVFARLGQLEAGDSFTVLVSDTGAAAKSATTDKVRFTVDKLVHAPKREFPTEEVYRATPDAQLRLITCSGPYDRVAGSYEDNTVVFATAQSPAP